VSLDAIILKIETERSANLHADECVRLTSEIPSPAAAHSKYQIERAFRIVVIVSRREAHLANVRATEDKICVLFL